MAFFLTTLQKQLSCTPWTETSLWNCESKEVPSQSCDKVSDSHRGHCSSSCPPCHWLLTCVLVLFTFPLCLLGDFIDVNFQFPKSFFSHNHVLKISSQHISVVIILVTQLVSLSPTGLPGCAPQGHHSDAAPQNRAVQWLWMPAFIFR